MPKFKDGVVWAMMDPRLERVIPLIDEVHVHTVGRVAIITSAREGTHSENSWHYAGRAIDLRTRDLSLAKQIKLVNTLREKLGPNWDVVLESDHAHLELDARADREA